MKTIIRNTVDLSTSDRTALEHLLGEPLSDDQQLVIEVVNVVKNDLESQVSNEVAAEVPALPEWCDVYAGLSDDQITDLERVILQRADLSRPS